MTGQEGKRTEATNPPASLKKRGLASHVQNSEMDEKLADFLVIGGGIAGCTLSYQLAKRGQSVTLLEAGIVGGQGASSVPVALLNPFRGRSARASELDLRGLESIQNLADELKRLGLEPGVHATGVLRIASNHKQAKTWRKREGVRWLEAEELENYHAPFGGFLVKDGGWLEPQKLLASLVTAARKYGAQVQESCEVWELEPHENGVTVKTSSGNIQAGTVILCVGATPNPNLNLPALAHVAGDVIGLKSDVLMPHALAGAVYGTQTGETVYIGGNHRPAGEEDPSAATQLQKAASWFVPALKTAGQSSVWTGVRAKADDNQPLVEQIEPNIWFFGALAGRGFLCSAHLSRQLAETLLRR